MYYCPKCKTYSVASDKRCLKCNTSYLDEESGGFACFIGAIALIVAVYGLIWAAFQFYNIYINH